MRVNQKVANTHTVYYNVQATGYILLSGVREALSGEMRRRVAVEGKTRVTNISSRSTEMFNIPEIGQEFQ
jgi:hypothetical protein